MIRGHAIDIVRPSVLDSKKKRPRRGLQGIGSHFLKTIMDHVFFFAFYIVVLFFNFVSVYNLKLYLI